MSALTKLFNYKINQYATPDIPDLTMTVKKNKNGEDIITWEPTDFKKIVADNGTVDMWSLNALIAAGINPDIPIHTGYNTRLEGAGELGIIDEEVEKLLTADSAEVVSE